MFTLNFNTLNISFEPFSKVWEKFVIKSWKNCQISAWELTEFLRKNKFSSGTSSGKKNSAPAGAGAGAETPGSGLSAGAGASSGAPLVDRHVF